MPKLTNTTNAKTVLKTIAALLLCSCSTLSAMPATTPAPADDCQTGINSYDAENYDAAIDLLSKCLQRPLRDPARAFALQIRAECHFNLKQPDRALEDQKTSLQLAPPKDVWPLIRLAAYHRELRQYDSALAVLKDALNYDEDGPGTGPGMAVYYHTGQTLHAAGRYAEAIEAYTLGIPKQPDYGYALYRRALAYEALGDKTQAKRDLFRAAELEPKEGYEAEIKTKFAEYGIPLKSK